MNRDAKDFREAAIERKIDYWPIHDCSICGYECGFLFFQYEEAEVVYDNGCDCTRRYIKSARNWDNVAELYNIAKENEEVMKKYNEHWGFE